MKKRVLKIITVFCVVMLVFSVMPISALAARNTQEVQKEIEEKKNRLNELEAEIEATEGNKAAAEKAWAEYEAQYNELVKLIDEQEALITSTEDSLGQKTAELSDTIESIQKNKELFEQRLLAIYEMNNSSAMLATLLSVEDFSGLMVASDAMQRISKHDTELLEHLDTDKKQFEQQKADLEAMIASLNEELAQLATNRDWCTQKMTEMNNTIAAANLAIQQNEQETEQAEEELLQLIRELEAIFRESQQKGSQEGDGSVRYDGPLLWPVPGHGRVSSYFGDPRSNTRNHYGIDIPAAAGTPIVAAASGTVITATWNDSYGNYIILDHGGGMRTLYAHCTALYVGVGTPVTIGDTIAGVGNTGNSYGAHLHFEVHDHGARQNPLSSGYLNL